MPDEKNVEPPKKERTRRSFLPLLIQMHGSNQQIVIKSMTELPIGVDFKVLETNHKTTYQTAGNDEPPF